MCKRDGSNDIQLDVEGILQNLAVPADLFALIVRSDVINLKGHLRIMRYRRGFAGLGSRSVSVCGSRARGGGSALIQRAAQ